MARKATIVSFDRDTLLQRIAWYSVNGNAVAAVTLRTLFDWATPPYRLTPADEAQIMAYREALDRPGTPAAPLR